MVKVGDFKQKQYLVNLFNQQIERIDTLEEEQGTSVGELTERIDGLETQLNTQSEAISRLLPLIYAGL